MRHVIRALFTRIPVRGGRTGPTGSVRAVNIFLLLQLAYRELVHPGLLLRATFHHVDVAKKTCQVQQSDVDTNWSLDGMKISQRLKGFRRRCCHVVKSVSCYHLKPVDKGLFIFMSIKLPTSST